MMEGLIEVVGVEAGFTVAKRWPRGSALTRRRSGVQIPAGPPNLIANTI